MLFTIRGADEIWIVGGHGAQAGSSSCPACTHDGDNGSLVLFSRRIISAHCYGRQLFEEGLLAPELGLPASDGRTASSEGIPGRP